jgi:hypothetical protein
MIATGKRCASLLPREDRDEAREMIEPYGRFFEIYAMSAKSAINAISSKGKVERSQSCWVQYARSVFT